MARIEFKGLDQYMEKLNRISALSRDKVIGAAVYDGAAVITDEVRAALEAVPTDDRHQHGEKSIGPSAEDKQAVLDALGIARIQNDNGFLNVKVGFTKDYTGDPTPGYPRGKPILMLARSIRSGTSWMQGNDFIKAALRRSRKQAIMAMKMRVEMEIQDIMK